MFVFHAPVARRVNYSWTHFISPLLSQLDQHQVYQITKVNGEM